MAILPKEGGEGEGRKRRRNVTEEEEEDAAAITHCRYTQEEIPPANDQSLYRSKIRRRVSLPTVVSTKEEKKGLCKVKEEEKDHVLLCNTKRKEGLGAASAAALTVLSEWIGNNLIDQSVKSHVVKKKMSCQKSSSTSSSSDYSKWKNDEHINTSRVSMIQVLGKLVHARVAEPRHVSLLALQLKSFQRQDRLEAVKMISSFPLSISRAHLISLAEGLHDVCEKVRAATLEALTGFLLLSEAGPFVPQVLASLEDLSFPVRRAAWKAVGALGSKQLIGREDLHVMAMKLKSRSPQIREATLRAFASLPTETLFGLHGMFASLIQREPAWPVRTIALELLGRLPTELWEGHLCVIIQRLGDSRIETQQAALSLLQKVDAEVLKLFVEDLLALARNNGNNPTASSSAAAASSTQSYALSALTCLPCTAVEPYAVELATVLLPQLITTSGEAADRMIEVLGRMRTEILLPLLDPIMDHLISRLKMSWSIDPIVAKHAAHTIRLIRNSDIQREVVARLVNDCVLTAVTTDGDDDETRRRSRGRKPQSVQHHHVRALKVLGDLGIDFIQRHQSALLSCLVDDQLSSRVCHEIFSLLLSTCQPCYGLALARVLIQRRNDRWLDNAAEFDYASVTNKTSFIREALMTMMDSDDVEERQGAMQVLARMPEEGGVVISTPSDSGREETKEEDNNAISQGVEEKKKKKTNAEGEDIISTALEAVFNTEMTHNRSLKEEQQQQQQQQRLDQEKLEEKNE